MLGSFLTKSRSRWDEYWADFKLRRAPVAPADLPLARFIYERKGKIKWIEEDGVKRPVARAKAFEPPRNLKLSAMQTRDIDEDRVWELDQTRPGGATAIAVAHFKAEHAQARGLDVRMDDHPPRHVTIWRWHTDTYERLAAMNHLADCAVVQMR